MRSIVGKAVEGDDGNYQDSGQPALQGDRRPREGVPRASIEGGWPYVWGDATYLKVPKAGRIVSVAVGVNGDGRREVLGMAIGASEAETFWTDFLRSLARRGLRGVKLIVSDAHEASRRPYRGCSAQPATVSRHFARNAMAHAGKSGRRIVSAAAAARCTHKT
jgi:putative transposase